MDIKSKKVSTKAQWDFPDWKRGVWNDKSLVKYFYNIIKDYDVIAGQNSDQFDCKVFNTRLAFHKLSPLPDRKTFDTKKIAKSTMHLPSYSLEDMAHFFGLGHKLHHKGLDMWFSSRDGNKIDQRMMKKYNGLDVILTRDVLLRILPVAKQTGDFVFVNKDGITCPNPSCLSTRMWKSKDRIVKGGYRKQYQCADCGSYYTVPKLHKRELDK
jgi:DNA polymerase elongation subunit (family B)